MTTHSAAPAFTPETTAAASGDPFRLGSPEHLRAFCRMLLDTHNPYRPAILDWPQLSPDAKARLVKLPIWDIAVQTEGRAGLNVATYAQEIGDPLLKEAVELNAFEEKRHKIVLSNLVQAYGIALAPEPVYAVPRDPEWSFLVTGYSECIDSFFAFGLFHAAKATGYFPEELVETFEPVIQEEARHIVFFVNWVAWHRRTMAWWRRPFFELKVLRVWLFLIFERIGIARDVGHGVQDNNFTASGASQLGSDIKAADLIRVCLSENDRRMARLDLRLLRPATVPAFARFALRFMRAPKKVSP